MLFRSPDAILIDIGTTTTDIVPIRDGRVVARGLTDLDRLMADELLYTGAVRTPVETITTVVPVPGGTCSLAAEAFALSGDVHLWRGHLRPQDYTSPTPDGRPPTRKSAGIRLARVVCGDRDLIDTRAVTRIADAIAEAQIRRITRAIRRVRGRGRRRLTRAIVVGVGEFLGESAARRAGLRVVKVSHERGRAASRAAAAVAVAGLLSGSITHGANE